MGKHSPTVGGRTTSASSCSPAESSGRAGAGGILQWNWGMRELTLEKSKAPHLRPCGHICTHLHGCQDLCPLLGTSMCHPP